MWINWVLSSGHVERPSASENLISIRLFQNKMTVGRAVIPSELIPSSWTLSCRTSERRASLPIQTAYSSKLIPDGNYSKIAKKLGCPIRAISRQFGGHIQPARHLNSGHPALRRGRTRALPGVPRLGEGMAFWYMYVNYFAGQLPVYQRSAKHPFSALQGWVVRVLACILLRIFICSVINLPDHSH